MHSLETHSNLLVAWVVNTSLPIMTWGILKGRPVHRITLWCIGNAILSISALVTYATYPSEGLLTGTIAFLAIPISSMCCMCALQLETAKWITPTWGWLLLGLAYFAYLLIYLYGCLELRLVFTQFTHAGSLSLLFLYVVTVYRAIGGGNAQWLAYSYIPAILGIVALPSTLFQTDQSALWMHVFVAYDMPFTYGLLVMTISSQFAYIALALQKRSPLTEKKGLPDEAADHESQKVEIQAHASICS